MNNKYKELISNTKTFAISNFATKIILFLLVPFYTYKLSSSEFGMVELLIALSNIIIPLASLGIYEAVFRYSFDETYSTEDILCSFYQMFFISCLVFGLFSVFLISKYGKILSVLFFFLSSTTLLHTAYSLFIKARGSTKLFAVDSVVYSIILVIANILLLAVFEFGIVGYVASIIISNLVSIIFLMYFGNVPKFCISTKPNAKLSIMLKYSLPLIFNSIAWMIISYSDRFMLNFFLTTSAVGLYSVASKIPSLLNTIFNIFNQAWSISSIKQFESNSMSKIFYSYTFKYYYILIVFSANSLLWIIKPFMRIYVSSEYYIAYIYVPLLLVAACFLGIVNYFGSVLASGKDSKSVMYSSLIGSLSNIGLNYLLIPRFQIMGAVIATAISYLVIAVYRFIVSRSIIKFDISFFNIIVSFLLIALQATLISLEADAVIVSSLISFGLIVVNFKSLVTLLKLVKDKNLLNETDL